MRHLVVLVFAVGCADSGGYVLPLVDADGEVAGTFEPPSGKLTVQDDLAASVATPTEKAVLNFGRAKLDDDLVPGDTLVLHDDEDQILAVLTVGEADELAPSENENAENTQAQRCPPWIVGC